MTGWIVGCRVGSIGPGFVISSGSMSFEGGICRCLLCFDAFLRFALLDTSFGGLLRTDTDLTGEVCKC